MRKVFAALLSVSLLLNGLSAHADRITSSWGTIPEAGTEVGVYGASYTEGSVTLYPSYVMGRSKNPNGKSSIDFVCESASDPKCVTSDFPGIAQMIIPPCEVDSTSMCIEGLSVGKDSSLQPAKFLRLVKSKKVEGNRAAKVPNGYNQSLWNVPISNGFSEQNFAVYVIYKSTLNGSVLDFQALVNPYTENRDSRYREQTASNEPISDGGQRIVGSNGDYGCIWIEEGLCGKASNFQEGMRVELKLRVFDGLAGWLSGRLKAPEISIEDAGNSLRTMKISGEPVSVQKAFAKVKITDATAELKSEVAYVGIKENQQYLFTSSANDSKAIEFFNVWAKYWPDNAASVQTYWGFSSLLGSDQPCLSDKSRVVGLVTTNAMVYDGTPPLFKDGEIQYRVASVHNDPSGKQFQGNYDLVIDSKVARCLYNYTNAPISASVSISSSEGNQSVATTVVSEKNGWFRMGAYGFHYSAPTIKVRLSQEVVTPSPSPSPSATPTSIPSTNASTAPSESPSPVATATPQSTVIAAPVKKITITCVKGKLVKKVTAANQPAPQDIKGNSCV
ncbi:MAG: hypothetical protein ACKOFJ_00220 [Actinomycetota bacterium]